MSEPSSPVWKQAPIAMIAFLAMWIAGVGSEVFLFSRYNGLVVQPSKFLTVIGLLALCLAGAKLAEWAIREMIASGRRR